MRWVSFGSVALAVCAHGSNAPKAIPSSVSSCADLGWANAAEYGDEAVCSESDTGLGCSGLLTWPEAAEFCETAGARLCTAAEIKNKNTYGSGCDLDSKFIWSNTDCDGGFITMTGRGTSPFCVSGNEEKYTRCCADQTDKTNIIPVPVKTLSLTTIEMDAVSSNLPQTRKAAACNCINFEEEMPGEK